MDEKKRTEQAVILAKEQRLPSFSQEDRAFHESLTGQPFDIMDPSWSFIVSEEDKARCEERMGKPYHAMDDAERALYDGYFGYPCKTATEEEILRIQAIAARTALKNKLRRNLSQEDRANWEAARGYPCPFPPPLGTGPDTPPRQERELTQWMRKTWEAEGKPNGSAFFSRLKKYVGLDGSPITQHYTVGGKSGGGVGWKTSKTNGERTKASIVNMVSRFKNEDKAKQTGST